MVTFISYLWIIFFLPTQVIEKIEKEIIVLIILKIILLNILRGENDEKNVKFEKNVNIAVYVTVMLGSLNAENVLHGIIFN